MRLPVGCTLLDGDVDVGDLQMVAALFSKWKSGFIVRNAADSDELLQAALLSMSLPEPGLVGSAEGVF